MLRSISEQKDTEMGKSALISGVIIKRRDPVKRPVTN